MADIRARCRQWHRTGYRAAMFLSGKGDLEDSIGGLIRHNLWAMAEGKTTPPAPEAGTGTAGVRQA